LGKEAARNPWNNIIVGYDNAKEKDSIGFIPQELVESGIVTRKTNGGKNNLNKGERRQFEFLGDVVQLSLIITKGLVKSEKITKTQIIFAVRSKLIVRCHNGVNKRHHGNNALLINNIYCDIFDDL